jgi:hypothetical protein
MILNDILLIVEYVSINEYVTRILHENLIEPSLTCRSIQFVRCDFRSKENGGVNNDDDTISISSSQRSDGYSTPSSTSINMDDVDENFLPDLYDFEESLAVQPTVQHDTELKFIPAVDLDIADSMDTIVNNVDSRSAMAFD